MCFHTQINIRVTLSKSIYYANNCLPAKSYADRVFCFDDHNEHDVRCRRLRAGCVVSSCVCNVASRLVHKLRISSTKESTDTKQIGGTGCRGDTGGCCSASSDRRRNLTTNFTGKHNRPKCPHRAFFVAKRFVSGGALCARQYELASKRRAQWSCYAQAQKRRFGGRSTRSKCVTGYFEWSSRTKTKHSVLNTFAERSVKVTFRR